MLKTLFITQWKSIVVVLIFLGVGILFLYSGITNSWEECQLIQKGEIVNGFITNTWEDAEDSDSGGLIWSHGAVYTYQLPDGRNFERTFSGEGRLKIEFRYLSQPYPIEVIYLPDNPAVSRIMNDLPDTLWGVMRKQLFEFVIAIICFILGFYVLYRLIRESRHSSNPLRIINS